MKIDLKPDEVQLLVTELESIIPELRGIIASGCRKDLRDEMKQDKLKLMEILEKLKAVA
jgi:hypothetical protein